MVDVIDTGYKMKDLRIIQVSDADMNELLEPLSELFDKYRQFYKQPPNKAQSKSFIRKRIENQDSVIFVALNNNSKIVGFAQLYPSFSSVTTQKKWILNDLYVSKDSRRQGVAKQLLSRVSQHAAETQAGSIFLETQVSNISAQALYESFGYVKEEEHHTYFIKISTL
jgi:ribosomal protein S18 acetylase RimI-like enzyme